MSGYTHVVREPIDRLLDHCEWDGDCLVWQGKSTRGYGQFRPGTHVNDPLVYVHRYVYETTVGQVPDGCELDHVAARGCSSRACVNPDHLEPVTHAENRARSRLSVCRSGRHDLTDPANIRWDAHGNRRGCLACRREAQQRRKVVS